MKNMVLGKDKDEFSKRFCTQKNLQTIKPYLQEDTKPHEYVSQVPGNLFFALSRIKSITELAGYNPQKSRIEHTMF